MDAVDVYKRIKTMVAQGNVQIVNQNNNQVMYQKELTASAQIDSEDEDFNEADINQINDEILVDEVSGRSPDFKQGGNARLEV